MSDQFSHAGRYLSPNHIIEIATSFQKSRVLLTAFELGIFNVLSRGHMSSNEVARAIGANPRATDRLLHALAP